MNPSRTILALFLSTGFASAASILTPSDFIIAIDSPGTTSSYPSGEAPANAIDGSSGSKYLNFAEEGSGFIVTPSGGASTAQSIRWTTADDAPERDPASFSLYGTNSAINSLNNSDGSSEPWSLITSSAVGLPATRLDSSTVTSFANVTSFTSYKLTMDTVFNASLANSMQIGDIQLFPDLTASAGGILTAGAPILAIAPLGATGTSSYPGAEAPANTIDVTLNKYLNFGGQGTGFIVTPGVGPSIINSFQITTANDEANRDPDEWTIFGTNDIITSTDNSDGDGEYWTLIDSGTVDLPTDRDTVGPDVAVAGSTAYSSYKVVFDSLRNDGEPIMQIGEMQFDGVIVPEPSTSLLAASALLGLLIRRQRG